MGGMAPAFGLAGIMIDLLFGFLLFHRPLPSWGFGMNGAGNCKAVKLPITTIAKQIIAEEQL